MQEHENKKERMIYDVKINILHLVGACRALGEVRVRAAGSLYASLETDEYDRQRLTNAGIEWSRD